MANKKSPSSETRQNNTKSPDLAGKKDAEAKPSTAPTTKETVASTPSPPVPAEPTTQETPANTPPAPAVPTTN